MSIYITEPQWYIEMPVNKEDKNIYAYYGVLSEVEAAIEERKSQRGNSTFRLLSKDRKNMAKMRFHSLEEAIDYFDSLP